VSSAERFRQRVGVLKESRSNSATGLILVTVVAVIALLAASSLIPGVSEAASNRKQKRSD